LNQLILKIENIFYLYIKQTSYPNEEVNRTKPSPSVSYPCLNFHSRCQNVGLRLPLRLRLRCNLTGSYMLSLCIRVGIFYVNVLAYLIFMQILLNLDIPCLYVENCSCASVCIYCLLIRLHTIFNVCIIAYIRVYVLQY